MPYKRFARGRLDIFYPQICAGFLRFRAFNSHACYRQLTFKFRVACHLTVLDFMYVKVARADAKQTSSVSHLRVIGRS
jgi:hypothetical protein